MIFRPNRKQLEDLRLIYESLYVAGDKALEEIEDALIEMSLGCPGLVCQTEEGLLGALSYEIRDGIISLNHIGSLKKGTGKEMLAKLEELRPSKIVLSARYDAFGFYLKLGYTKGERYGDFYKEVS